MEFLQEVWLFIRTRKRFWMIPLIIILLLLALSSALTGGSVLAPFIYTLF